MDDRSAVAAIQETLRLSSAGRAAVRLGVPGEAVLTGPRARPEVVQVAALGVQAPTAAWSVRLGPPLAVDLGLAPWSFRDVSVRATRRLPRVRGPARPVPRLRARRHAEQRRHRHARDARAARRHRGLAGAPVIDARDLVKRYGALRALDGLTLSVERGELVGLVGPNG